jgi:hypothetical protein
MEAANFHRKFSHEFARIAALLNECRNDKKLIGLQKKSKYSKISKIYF